MKLLALTSTLIWLALAATPSYGFFLDGDGHYSLRGETRTKPGFSSEQGTYQAIQQFFRLRGEARFNERSSMYLEFRLFDNPRATYLGDTPEPDECQANNGRSEDPEDPDNPCRGAHQNTGEPRYRDYLPRVSKLYVRYAFDFCILEAGRRGRDWGMGIFMDEGNDPFDTEISVYDGISCHINVQKSQPLGFAFGVDKLAETGTYVNSELVEGDPQDREFGANDRDDDINQYFFQIEFDDRRANAGAFFTKQIGVYFANVVGTAFDKDSPATRGGSNTDLKFLDLYTGFYIGSFAWRNELLFRMGKSGDPSYQGLGGRKESDSGNPATNKLEALAVAGNLEYVISRSGAPTGPVEFHQGDVSRHLVFLDYAYAPGDRDGYFRDIDESTGIAEAERNSINEEERDNKVSGLALHRNYKPALILLNGRPEFDAAKVDGVFDPGRLLNVNLLGLGYRYESFETGNFEAKLITATLSEGIPNRVKQFYETYEDALPVKPIGFYGKSLGYELDLKYSYSVGREITLGAALAAALPGKGWKVRENKEPEANVLLQSSVSFRF